MLIKQLIDEDVVNFKEIAMFLAFPRCSFKCEKECGVRCCQNSALARSQSIDISTDEIIRRYLRNPITGAIVLGGLEPFDSYDDMLDLIATLRYSYHCKDTVVIYTGYCKDEILQEVNDLTPYGNIIIKFGRFIPGCEKHLDEVLGVQLASPNQYAERIC